MLRRILREPRHLPFAIAVLAVLLVVPEIPSPAARPGAAWRGRYVLLYREDAASAVEAALARVVAGSVSRAGATVRIDAFSEIETLPVAAVGERLDELDPRRDAWLSGVGRYFHASDGRQGLAAAYVPASCGRVVAGVRLARAFRAAGVPRAGWRLLELEPLVLLPVPLAALCFAIFLAGWLRPFSRRGTLVAILGAAAWLPGLLNGGLPDLFLFCTALCLWAPRALGAGTAARGRLDPRAPAAEGISLGALLGVAAAVVAADGAVVYRIVRAGASTLSLELLAELVEPLGRLATMKSRATGRFEHVPIRARRRAPPLVPVAGVLAAALLAAVPAMMSPLRIALPRAAFLAAGDERSDTAAVDRGNGADRLPGLAEAVAHAASLQTLAFANAGAPPPATPPRDGRVIMRDFAGPNAAGSLVETPRAVARFDTDWARRTVRAAAVGSVERLLADQHRQVEVSVRPLRATLPRSLPAALACLFVLAALSAATPVPRPLIRFDLWTITDSARSRRNR